MRGMSWVLAAGLCGGVFAAAPGKEDKKAVFDRGEKDDFEKGIVYKPEAQKKREAETKKKVAEKATNTLKYHLKNLKDPDPEVRKVSCDMLGLLGIPEAVPELIEVLRPARNEKIQTQLAANAALARITGKNFGYKNYEGWTSWWVQNKNEFLKKKEIGVDEPERIAAVAANTMGLEMMRRGEYRSAQQQFLDAVNRDPTVPDYHNNLGLSLMEQGRYLDGMTHFEETIAMNNALPQPYMNIGHCYSRMNKTIEAQTWYKKALTTDKENKLWEPQWMLGKEYMKRGEWAMAYDFLDQARVKSQKSNIHDPRLYKDLAITHYGMDQYHSAWKEIKNVETLGFECDKGFVAKVRKALTDQGIDPDVEDKNARATLKGLDDDEL